MKYVITGANAPKMPKLGEGTECIKLIASQISPDMREAIVPMIFPALGAYLNNTECRYRSGQWMEICGQMAHLIADSGMGKGQLTSCIEILMRKFREHDDEEMKKLVNWQKIAKSKGNKEKPLRPEVAFWFPPSNVTNAAFIQNAMACEMSGNRTQYYDMAEIEMADQMCGSHNQVSQTMRIIYDKQRGGTLRATADGVTGNPTLRVNMTFSSTPIAARKFYRNELTKGTFGRVVFSYKARNDRSSKIPVYGSYDDKFIKEIDKYLKQLEECEGRYNIDELNALIKRINDDLVTIADLADDNSTFDLGKRALISAWKNGCILYFLNQQKWTRSMGELVEWMVYHDLWSKMQIFGDLLMSGDKSISEARNKGPKNMLEDLPESFNEAQLETLRINAEKSKEGTLRQLRVWKSRHFVTYDAETGLYTKTKKYLKLKN